MVTFHHGSSILLTSGTPQKHKWFGLQINCIQTECWDGVESFNLVKRSIHARPGHKLKCIQGSSKLSWSLLIQLNVNIAKYQLRNIFLVMKLLNIKIWIPIMILHNIVHFTCIKVTFKTEEDNIITPQVSSWGLTSPGRPCPWSPPWLSPRQASSWSPPQELWYHPSSSRATCPSSRTAEMHWTIKSEFWKY